jgi:hypothetical protein
MLGLVSSIFGIISAIVSVIALIIAIQSYQISTQKANLHLWWSVYQMDEGHIDGEGIAKFCSENDASVETKSEMVTICRPGGEIEFCVENRGKVAAKNVVMDIRFENMAFSSDNIPLREGWKTIDHIHGMGLWQGIRWEPGAEKVLHPGIPIRFQEFGVSGCHIGENAKMHVILSADNANVNRFTIPVKIE